MKKLLSIAAIALLISCNKTQLQPDPAPPYIAPEEKVDTSKHDIVNTWNCYQYKYMYNGATWIMQTNWRIQILNDQVKVDEMNDGTYEQVYTSNLDRDGGELTIQFPAGSKTYEIRPTRVGQKQGYDLVATDKSNDPDTYSLLK